jgi:hypothetical protein
MRPGGRPLPAAVIVAALLAVVLLAPASPLVERTPAEEPTTDDVRFVRPADEGTELWPYTSRARPFGRATLPVNAVVLADADTVYRLLAFTPERERRLYWNATAETWVPGRPDQGNVTINGTGCYWAESSGSTRYTFMRSSDGSTWTDATDQLHDGTYFGSRYHLRLYAEQSGNRSWTAVQAHHEHWDWFRLRHDVNSLVRAKQYLERDFRGTGLLTGMRRERWGNGGAIDADGWVTVIELRDRVVLGPRRHVGGAPSPPNGLPVPFLGLALAIPTYLAERLAAGRESLERLRGGRLSRCSPRRHSCRWWSGSALSRPSGRTRGSRR